MKTKIIFIFWLSSLACQAQVTVTSGALLTIQPNNTFFASGDFTNNGTVLNDGSLIISGAWTNTGTYQAESGQVTFNGSGQQVINHNAQSFATLVISGGGEKIFDADIVIANELSLQSGILTTNNHSRIILQQPAIVTGGSANSYVEGPVYQTGTGQKLFPVGINSKYLPLTFTNVAGTSPVVGIEVIEPNPNGTVTPELTSVSSNRYWLQTTMSGTFTGSPVVLPTLGENESSSLVVVQSPGPNDPFHSLGGTITSGSIESRDMVTQAWIAIGTESSNGILVYNAVTPGIQDGKHDFLKIVNIDKYPNNEVTIVNRWGDKVFQISGYNNLDRVFKGDGNTGGASSLGDGTYFYVIDKKNGDEKISGFFELRR